MHRREQLIKDYHAAVPSHSSRWIDVCSFHQLRQLDREPDQQFQERCCKEPRYEIQIQIQTRLHSPKFPRWSILRGYLDAEETPHGVELRDPKAPGLRERLP